MSNTRLTLFDVVTDVLYDDLYPWLDPSSRCNLSTTCRFFYNLYFKPNNDAAAAKLLPKLLHHVVRNKIDEAETMLIKNPNLIFYKGTVRDYAKRFFHSITAFQYAVWAGNDKMWEMLEKYLPKEEATAQFKELEQKGTEYGKYYDISELLSSLNKYRNSYSKIGYISSLNYWILIVGKAQRHLPTNVAAEVYFSGSHSLFFFNQLSESRTHFYSPGLGVAFAVSSGSGQINAYGKFQDKTKLATPEMALADYEKIQRHQQYIHFKRHELKQRLLGCKKKNDVVKRANKRPT